jgi:hypothetical protein
MVGQQRSDGCRVPLAVVLKLGNVNGAFGVRKTDHLAL